MLQARFRLAALLAQLGVLLFGTTCLGSGDVPDGVREMRQALEALGVRYWSPPRDVVPASGSRSSSSSSSSEESRAARTLNLLEPGSSSGSRGPSMAGGLYRHPSLDWFNIGQGKALNWHDPNTREAVHRWHPQRGFIRFNGVDFDSASVPYGQRIPGEREKLHKVLDDMARHNFVLTRSGLSGRQSYTSYNSATGKWEPIWQDGTQPASNIGGRPARSARTLTIDEAAHRNRRRQTLVLQGHRQGQEQFDGAGLSLAQPGPSTAGASSSAAPPGGARSRSTSQSSGSNSRDSSGPSLGRWL
ncbi:hypothetical protein IE81DRAFT_344022 [Ceraceosorus guamensis]|uniref:Uncharacterized protein n=1 Tax=Ceraceosorus guamensis TaxID=1522189 RepID=A0A316W999_9BASI|nr:hypothetical protein IE81DRAFT_344022 [Ceraceosorus guamensis]PWN46412.1 hypothetical protein IE81DRAFT_344022 [Ceraceosorus guamensis]